MNIEKEKKYHEDMIKQGWKEYGTFNRNNVKQKEANIPPWFNIFYETWNQGNGFIWIKE